ncbi:MAG: 50S ribosomal protein L11 methyltransferase [Deltaproteobacteria bacterium]|nr:MAG: 50S ribosomal protein L11 methyltransferase [Deltaproteobacteria bacterium]
MKPSSAKHDCNVLSVRVSKQWAEAVGELLLAIAPSGFELVDSEHPSPPCDLEPGFAELRIFVPARQTDRALQNLLRGLESLRRACDGFDCFVMPARPVHPQDWEDGWKRHFKPVVVGRFYIHPGWLEPAPDIPWPVRIDPGLAFGTGLHPTTRMCLERLDAAVPVDSFLEAGCGTGILAIAAAKAGCRHVVAIDVDPEACRQARRNAALNGAGHVMIKCEDVGKTKGSYELVAANILSGVLVDNAEALTSLVLPGGALLCTGITEDEQELVEGVFTSCGLRLDLAMREGEWVLCSFVKR